jgi:hypothetical protein
LCAAISRQFFNPEQKKALANALGKQHERFSLELFWRDIDFSDLPFLQTLLSAIPQDKLLDKLLNMDDTGNTEIHSLVNNTSEVLSMILRRLPPEELLGALESQNDQGETVLHSAVFAQVTESVQIILSLIQAPERLDFVMIRNNKGESALEKAAVNPEVLKAILDLIPQEQHLQALAEAKGDKTLLSFSAQNPESLRFLLSLIPEDKRLEQVSIQDFLGQTPLHNAAQNHESLKMLLNLYPENEAPKAVMVKDNEGRTVVHFAHQNPESLRMLLNLYPMEQRLELLKMPTKSGQTLLHKAASHPESLSILLSLYPENNRLEALKAQDNRGRSVLEMAASHFPKSLETLLNLLPKELSLDALEIKTKSLFETAIQNCESLNILLKSYPKEERLNAVKQNNRAGYCLLFSAAKYPKSLKLILSLYPEQERLAAVTTAVNGKTVLNFAQENTSSVTTILSLLPEESRLAFLKSNVCSSGLPKSVCELLYNELVQLPDSFAPLYIGLHRSFSAHKQLQSSRPIFWERVPVPNSVFSEFANSQTVEEVKQMILDFLTNQRHQVLPLFHEVWNLVAPDFNRDINALRRQWNMPLEGPPANNTQTRST